MKLNKTDLENKPEHCLTRPKWGNTSALLRVSSDQFATSASPKATSGLISSSCAHKQTLPPQRVHDRDSVSGLCPLARSGQSQGKFRVLWSHHVHALQREKNMIDCSSKHAVPKILQIANNVWGCCNLHVSMMDHTICYSVTFNNRVKWVTFNYHHFHSRYWMLIVDTLNQNKSQYEYSNLLLISSSSVNLMFSFLQTGKIAIASD
jgi:hypothetical protein